MKMMEGDDVWLSIDFAEIDHTFDDWQLKFGVNWSDTVQVMVRIKVLCVWCMQSVRSEREWQNAVYVHFFRR